MSRRATDLMGKQFGAWTATKRDGRIGTNAAWLCRCENGHEKRISANRLLAGGTSKCKECQSNRLDEIYARDAEFVQAWQQAERIADVATELGISEQQARSVASRLRQHKVRLKRMLIGRNPKAEAHYVKMRKLAEETRASE